MTKIIDKCSDPCDPGVPVALVAPPCPPCSTQEIIINVPEPADPTDP